MIAQIAKIAETAEIAEISIFAEIAKINEIARIAILWTRRMQFWQHFLKILGKGRKFIVQCPIIIKNWSFFRKLIVLNIFLDSWNTVLRSPPIKGSIKGRKFLIRYPKFSKNILFSEKYIIPKKSQWTRKMQLWQPCRKKLPEGHKTSAQAQKVKRKRWKNNNKSWTQYYREYYQRLIDTEISSVDGWISFIELKYSKNNDL